MPGAEREARAPEPPERGEARLQARAPRAARRVVRDLREERPVAERRRRRWVAGVKTVSTRPPAGLFTRDAGTIARTLASKKVSPKGPGSGMRMLTYFINRGGRGLSRARRSELERAKRLLSERVKRERERRRTAA